MLCKITQSPYCLSIPKGVGSTEMWDRFRCFPLREKKWIINNTKRIISESGTHAKCWPFCWSSRGYYDSASMLRTLFHRAVYLVPVEIWTHDSNSSIVVQERNKQTKNKTNYIYETKPSVYLSIDISINISNHHKWCQ